MKQVTTKAIILKRTNFQEADRILTLISPEYGKVKVIAKGVRKLKSKLAGGLELLSVSDVTYIVGRSNIYTVVSSRLDVHFQNIVNDIDRTMTAYDMIKQVDKITEDHGGQDFFIILEHGLQGLNDRIVDIQYSKLWFSLQLLKQSGHMPNLDKDQNDKPLKQDTAYTFDFENMGFIQSNSSGFTANHIKLLRFGVGLKTPNDFKKLDKTADYLDESADLANKILLYTFDQLH